MTNLKIEEVSTQIAGKTMSLKTGHMALQAHGAVTVQIGDLVVLVATAMGRPREGGDFFPMLVDYEEKLYAAGKIKGSRFIKREGRPPEESILRARMIDRPIRPLFPKGISNDVVISVSVLSSDGETDPGPHAITCASAALAVGGFPIVSPIAAVKIGLMNGELIVNPSYEQVAEGDLELVVAGSADGVMMVEAGSKEISDEQMIDAIKLAHEEIKKLCAAIEELKAKAGKVLPVEVVFNLPDESVKNSLKETITDAQLDAIYKPSKPEVYAALKNLTDEMVEVNADKVDSKEEDHASWSKKNITQAVDKIFKEYMRKNILESGKRVDGRGLDDVRPISVQLDPLPRPHGSAIFQRGETQVLSVLTLAGPGASQIIDLMDHDYKKSYFHHYNFPGYSVGEARGNRGVGRREIGHGFLAERALLPVLPKNEAFPYTMRVVSEILTCNGSSSMGSVCGSTLALMAGGVPITAPVSAIAMGMVADDESGKYQILTDIQGLEDFAGDMDLKYASTPTGITALQMDIKVGGISIERMHEAFTKAKIGRDTIGKVMDEAISEPRGKLAESAPMIETVQIDPEMIRNVIGKGGETIQGIVKETGAEIDIDDSGLIFITAPNQESGDKAKAMIKEKTYMPKMGDELNGVVNRTADFGAFVAIPGGKDGMIHISQLSSERVNNVTDVVKEGDSVKVKVTKIDEMGRIGLQLIEKL
ncbi:MAG: polyribonucleotide nucleotidyltransferase [Candidatus Gracilibacteria bacterium]|nr:polyribonucleotide nucleotidyltransferase [Candidatus Gracilibacteria bacterium]